MILTLCWHTFFVNSRFGTAESLENIGISTRESIFLETRILFSDMLQKYIKQNSKRLC